MLKFVWSYKAGIWCLRMLSRQYNNCSVTRATVFEQNMTPRQITLREWKWYLRNLSYDTSSKNKKNKYNESFFLKFVFIYAFSNHLVIISCQPRSFSTESKEKEKQDTVISSFSKRITKTTRDLLLMANYQYLVIY